MPENDIYRAYNFVLDLGGGESGYFTEVYGLSVCVENIEYREGGGAPGRARVGSRSGPAPARRVAR